MTDLASWLSAQLDHDEQLARRALKFRYDHPKDAPWEQAKIIVERRAATGPTVFTATFDPAHALRTVAAHRAILAEHLPTLTGVEWPHDTTGKGEALACPRCQNAEHTTNWNPPIGMAGVLPEGFVAPYVLAPCRTLLLLAAIYTDREGWDPSWKVET